MPGPFTHIYTARRLADFLRRDGVTDEFIRQQDGALRQEQQLLAELLAKTGRKQCVAAMDRWPKFTAVGAIGPDLFFFLQDYNTSAINSDELMLALSLLYWLDDEGVFDDPTEGLLTILAAMTEDPWAGILKILLGLWKAWKEFKEVWDRTIGPILDRAEQVIDDLTGGLISELAGALTQLKNALLELAQVEILTSGDIMQWFSLKMRQGFDEKAYLWSDMLHYRRTSIFPARLFDKARSLLSSTEPLDREHGEQLVAFAMGWVSHVGADTIAHAFVNEQCGGPFRTHWQRHHVIENHIDAWNYECTRSGQLPSDEFVGFKESYPDLASSALYFAVQIPQDIDGLDGSTPQEVYQKKQGDLRQTLPEGNGRNEQAERDELLDTDGALPLWLANTIAQVLVEVYAHPEEGGDDELFKRIQEYDRPHPLNLAGLEFQQQLKGSSSFIDRWIEKLDVVDKVLKPVDEIRKEIAPDPPPEMKIPPGFPLPWEIQAAYRLMLSWFKRSYLPALDMDKPEPPTAYTPSLSEIAESFGPPDFSGVNPNDDPISQGCEVVAALLDFVWKALTGIADFLYDLVKSIASHITLPARDILYRTITLPLWESAESMRNVLCHLGFVQPQALQLYDNGNMRRPNEIDETLITLGHSVDSAFAETLAANADVLGNLDTDPGLTNTGVREVLGAANPWLPIRVPLGEQPPFQLFNSTNVVEYQRPWAFPDRNNARNPKAQGNYIETPQTLAGPYVTNTLLHQLFQLDAIASNYARVRYEWSLSAATTDELNKAFIMGGDGGAEHRNPLGDPVVFSGYLAGQIANNSSFFGSYNLDADRGYGYLCWDWARSDEQNVSEVDGRGHSFNLPLTWPEGSEESKGPLRHWTRPENAPVSDQNRYPTPLKVVYEAEEAVPCLKVL